MPATTEVTPSVFEMVRPAWGLRLSESVALTDVASAAATVAVLVRVPVTEDLIVATTV